MMRRFVALLLMVCWPMVAGCAGPKIHKVLPHHLDSEGRHTLSPSLFERDAYQAYLRERPELVSTLRFDVHWRASRSDQLRLQVELRVTGEDMASPMIVVQKPVSREGWFSQWSSLRLSPAQYREINEIIAWRVSLWEADQLLDEYPSFLW